MTSPFPPSSRYHHVAELTTTLPDGTVVAYLARRLLPAVDRQVPLELRRLDGTERLDSLANEAYGDPLLWWRIADASGEEDPADLAGTVGRLVLIPLPTEITD